METSACLLKYQNRFMWGCVAYVSSMMLLVLVTADGVIGATTQYRLTGVSNTDMQRLARLSDTDRLHDDLLQPFLRTRVSGTPGNRAVQQHIKSVMTSLQWEVVEDRFSAQTPYGRRTFTNLVATQAPEAPRRLTFACHFDSKNFTSFVFIGATDSAVPCAMLLDLAVTLHQRLFSPLNKAAGLISLQFLFLDGEEAQITWSDRDSLYGSRHLASAMHHISPYRAYAGNQLQAMGVLILLDLVGTRDVRFANMLPHTDLLFHHLQYIEKRLSEEGLLSRAGLHYFPDATLRPRIVPDDSLPFYQRGVPVLHLISQPFPAVWHTPADDEFCLDYDVINDLSVVLRVFVAAYLWLV